MDIETVNAAGTLVLLIAVIAGVAFLLVYGALAKWWRTREGIYLFSSSAIFVAILTYNYLAVTGWFDDQDPLIREWVRLAIYVGGVAVMLWRGALLILAQLDDLQARRVARRKGATDASA